MNLYNFAFQSSNMKHYSFLLIVFTILPLLAVCQGNPVDFKNDKVIDRLRTDVAILASDSLQGRESGTAGERMASEYIINEFRKTRCKPAGSGDTSFLQPFPRRTVNISRYNKVSIGERLLTYKSDYGLLACSASGEVKGVINAIGWDNERTLHPRPHDCIALIDLDSPENYSGASGKRQSTDPFERLKQAVSHGACAIICWNCPSKYRKQLFDFTRFDTLTVPVINVSRDVAMELINDPGKEIAMEIGITRHTTPYCNVVGLLDHSAKKTIVFGAHYDHLGMTGDMAVCNGADDNASGTAAVLELARYFSAHPDPKANYLFICFSGEEKGLLGSEYFCDHPAVPVKDVLFMMNFDMVGRLGCMGNAVEMLGGGSSREWKHIKRKVDKNPMFRIEMKQAAPPFSDHYPFLQKEIPVVYFSTGTHRQYHTRNDDTHLINFDGLAGIVDYAERFTRQASQHEHIPFSRISILTQTLGTIGLLIQMLP
ncbi:MAG: M28 family peptidase [Bacteroidetes bacterium]|nr:M28 family peptidase [Bacteroidota bacterium]